ncbi:MAG TPA: hypothetical protein VFV50_15245 [Bdellovibrionales bacterium]|nr:hypothetical protein [Bdellovibrionales bacterium]
MNYAAALASVLIASVSFAAQDLKQIQEQLKHACDNEKTVMIDSVYSAVETHAAEFSRYLRDLPLHKRQTLVSASRLALELRQASEIKYSAQSRQEALLKQLDNLQLTDEQAGQIGAELNAKTMELVQANRTIARLSKQISNVQELFPVNDTSDAFNPAFKHCQNAAGSEACVVIVYKSEFEGRRRTFYVGYWTTLKVGAKEIVLRITAANSGVERKDFSNTFEYYLSNKATRVSMESLVNDDLYSRAPECKTAQSDLKPKSYQLTLSFTDFEAFRARWLDANPLGL